jgi:two-component system response regulator FlrC
MDLLQMNFKSQPLCTLKQEVESLLDTACALFLQGSEGSGKTSWAEAILKHRGSFVTLDAYSAPKSVREWKIFFQSQPTVGFLFDNLDQWNEAQKNSLLIALGQFDAIRRKIVTTSRFDLEPQFSFRLGTRKLQVPAVPDCTEDFSEVIQFWLKVHCLVIGTSVPLFSSASLQKLNEASWTGGWSELIMILERAISFKVQVVQPEHIQFDTHDKNQSYLQAGLTLAEMEKKLILQTLKLTASNKSQAARILGISIRTLRNKLNEYNDRRPHELV